MCYVLWRGSNVFCVIDREALMCYVLALLVMHVEGGPLHSPPPKTVIVYGEPVSFQSCRLSPSAFEWSLPGRNFTLNE